MGVIHGVYSSFDLTSIILIMISLFLMLIMIGMMFFRKDKRHLGDLIAKTQVQLISNNNNLDKIGEE